ncbi:hypothetical protein PCYB_006360 [Plasmodium cynomolgi strain B]|uniref:CYIR protein n=1 Tax=Plasmodium cynomolgi (strain B) TaxID=1120755 RepID=K6VKB6_PLACD|nr:hypothetical protein PCYB_006360 [Plasmodium cynomolgi strain B]GAB69887.1 hypothetical protein PCYB_006360 [Plasmodium cynomolgi strain B]
MVDSTLLENCPFLDDIWKKYNSDVAANYSNDSYILLSSYDYITNINGCENEKKDICRKLLRNLKELYNSNYKEEDFTKYCNNINHWLYYELKKHKINDDTINIIFKESYQPNDNEQVSPFCNYLTFYEGLFEPEKLVMLSIFNNNIPDNKEHLIKNIDSNIYSCENFINECVKIYKTMQEHYCSKRITENHIKNTTCKMLNMFREYYKENLCKKIINHELSEFCSYTPTNIIEDSSSEESESVQDFPIQINQSDPSIIQSVPLALGVMAGISSLLVLIYKVNITLIQIYE